MRVVKCGRCKGRGYIQPIRGIGHEDCPVCKGTGEKPHARHALGSNAVSLGTPPRGTICAFCPRPAAVYHHVCPQNRIDNYLTGDGARSAKADKRNGVPICHPCHDQVEHDRLQVSREQLHPGFKDFLAEYGLGGAVPRHLQEVAA